MKIVNMIKIIFAELVALVGLSIFTFLYSYSGVHIVCDNGATDYIWQSRQYTSTMVEGFSWVIMDANGYNNMDASLADNPDILLIGASHMEAVNLPQKYNTGYLLNEKLEGVTTYNIGISGHVFETCMSNLEAALGVYEPQKYVIVETNTLVFDETQLQNVLDKSYPEIPSYDSGLLYYLQKYIPAMKPIYKQITGKLSNYLATGTVAERNEEEISETYIDVLHDVLERGSDLCEGYDVKLIA